VRRKYGQILRLLTCSAATRNGVIKALGRNAHYSTKCRTKDFRIGGPAPWRRFALFCAME
jgi:hypothetical protein